MSHNRSLQEVVLTLNLGSTSLKAGIFDTDRLGSYSAPLSSRSWSTKPPPSQGESTTIPQKAGDFSQHGGDGLIELVEQIAAWLADQAVWPSAIVHRIVHGGPLHGPCLLNEENLLALSAISDWAPTHQAGALDLAIVTKAHWRFAKSVALFDTDWHKTMPMRTKTLPLSPELRSRGMHRYGFHGIAFQSAWRQFENRRPDALQRRVVCAHLGGGSSLCAVQGGKSIDTTMGLTPMDGLPMATRCGSLDPGLILYLLKTGAFTPDTLTRELCDQSGLRGISGLTGDMEVLLASQAQDAMLAIDIFTHRTAQGIASMSTTLQGIDDLVFSGGIGSHAPRIRTAIVEQLGWLGLRIDPVANETNAVQISDETSSAQIHVVEVHEDRELAASAVQWL